MARVETCYRFDRASARWARLAGEALERGKQLPAGAQLTAATYNILFGSPFPKTVLAGLTLDRQRFEFTVKQLLPKLRADVIGLNEVIPEFLALLCEDEFVRETYYLSSVEDDLRGYDSLILSKYPFHVFGIKRKRVAVFAAEGGFGVMVASAHLIAHETEDKMLYRFKELRELDELMLRGVLETRHLSTAHSFEQQRQSAAEAGNVLVMGDMNFHNLCETDVAYELGYEDAWLNLRGFDSGYTWDPKENPFIRLILPFDSRRMRLDRVLSKQATRHLEVCDITIFGRESIGQSRCCLQVFPSDHFGLLFKLRLATKQSDALSRGARFDYWQLRDKLLAGRNPKSTGFPRMQAIICKRIAAVVFAGLLLLAVVVVLIYLLVKHLRS